MQTRHVLLFCLISLSIYSVKPQGSCKTPNEENAKCIAIRSCKILYDAVLADDPEVVKFLRASQCGFDGQPLVCCGTRASYAPPTTSKPLVRRPDLLPTLNECGPLEDNRILNGNDTEPNEYPWTVLIKYKSSNGKEEFSCGGSLISHRYILTAAHCVTGPILSAIGTPISVRLGEWNTDTDKDCSVSPNGIRTCVPDKPVDVPIEETIPHNEYIDDRNVKANDIALIRLVKAIKFSDFIKPICIPQETDEVKVGEKLIVAGWGKTQSGQYSAIKQKLAVPVVSSKSCAATYSSRFGSFIVRDDQLCAGGEDGKDSCRGDSGGPLMAERDTRMYLAGVVSFGYECGLAGWPGVYTRINKFRDWIEGNLVD